MKDGFDQKLKEMSQKESAGVPELPADFDAHIERILQRLPEKRRKHMTWKGALVLAAVLTAMLTTTVAAAVNYVRQRMEAMNEEERISYYTAAQNSSDADFYSRELTDGEQKRLDSLKEAYQKEGVFPKGELRIIGKASEYNGTGVACMASRGTFFLPASELTDEEILQIIDFREKREFGLQDTAGKLEDGTLDKTAVPSGPAEVLIELKAEDMEIIGNGDTRAELAAASADTVYFGEQRLEGNQYQAAVYRLEKGSSELTKMDVQVPDGLSPASMDTDVQGNLCILLTTPDESQAVLWKISPEGKELARFDVTDIGGRKTSYRSVAIDDQGRYYLSEFKKSGMKELMVVVVGQDGSLVSKIPYKEGDIRGLGRARDGNVYGILMDGEDWIPTVVGFDIGQGRFNAKYAGVLPGMQGAYTKVSAGVDADLLIWGSGGIYSYNLGDEKAVLKKAQYELPAGGVLCILPDARAVFVNDDIIMNDAGTDIADIINKKFYLIQVEQ